MKRRAFCASAIATLGAAALPLDRLFAEAASIRRDIDAVAGDGKQITLSRLDVDDFRASLRGQLLVPGSAGYDDARKVWNGMFDRRPALIARCAGAADVVRSVNFARSAWIAGRGARRRSQPLRPVGLRQRSHDRPVADERRARDPARQRARVEPRRDGSVTWTARSLSFGLVTTDRHGFAHGCRWTDARRRLRPAGPRACNDLRQPDDQWTS